jgi:membrane protein DedA with SNARE-associated domain
MNNLLIHGVERGGLLAVLVLVALGSSGIPISNELVVTFAGALSGSGHLPLISVIVVATAGNTVGALVPFLLAKRYGERLMTGPGKHVGLRKKHVTKTRKLVNRWGAWGVLLAKMVPAVRTYISFPLGLSRMEAGQFSVLTIVAGIPWNAALAFAGYLLGKHWDRITHVMGPLTAPVVLAVAVAFALWGFRRQLRPLFSSVQGLRPARGGRRPRRKPAG